MKPQDPDKELDRSEIAIVGMAGRFPRAADVDAFWRNLRAGVDAVTFFGEDELRAAGVDESLLKNPNYVRARMVLEGADLFDAAMFGYTPREAELMDPQHRLFLECARTAIEHAGYVAETYRGLIGIFAGAGFPHYFINNVIPNKEVVELVGMLQATLGNESDSLASRVAYKLNLKGPSIGVQTFCSTSLVAVHLACQSLLSYECDMAMAGGVAVDSSQNTGYLYQAGGIASPDGHCRTFDAKAQGSIYGSGVGVVILKRLKDAIADGDSIHAVIKGSATNNDGALRVGYTAPGLEGQSAVVVEALAAADVESESISYIETHGTATPLGDSIELAALMKAFRGSQRKQWCAIGSLKPNVGHLDRAAGVANVIKVVQALRHKELPPSLHFEEPNPDVSFAASPFYVNTALTPWDTKGKPRRAGVSAFGLGGTNAHVVLEEWENTPTGDSRPVQLLTLSAKTETALAKATQDLAEHLSENPSVNLADAAFTLHVGRSGFNHRRAVVCRGVEDAIQSLTAADSTNAPRVLTAYQEKRDRPLVFLFPGLGEQYVNMAAGLYASEPRFKSEVDRCCELLRPEIGIDLREVMFAEDAASAGDGQARDLRKLFFRGDAANDAASTRLNQTWIAQPAMFVVEYALAQLLMGWGLVPQALIGYSVGEFTAATIAGSLSLEDGLRLVAARAKLIDALPGGAMLAVPVSEKDAAALLHDVGLTDDVSIAACNGPKLTVLAGAADAIARLEVALRSRELVSRRLPTTHAFHSRMLTPAYAAFVDILKTVTLRAPKIPYLSNLTGTWIRETEARDPEYWARHMCETVRFGDGIAEVLRGGDKVLVEVGPGQGLGSVVKQHPAFPRQGESIVVSTMKTVYASDDDQEVLLGALGRLWLAGTPIDWAGYYAGERRRRIPLPTYPFERQRYWLDAPRQLPRSVPEGRRSDIGDWFYTPEWREKTLASTSSDDGSQWLIFLDDHGIGHELAARLKNVATVKIGPAFSSNGAGGYVINPAEASDYKAVIKALKESGARVDRIVHLWSLTGEAEPSFDESQTRGFHSLQFIAKALGDNRITGPVRLDVVSDHLFAVDAGEDVCPAKATLLGPCRVIPQEYPNVTSRVIDVSISDPSCAPLLFKELVSDSTDVSIGYRENRRLVESFAATKLAPSEEVFRHGGVYVITGGLGGVGLILAEHLAKNFAAKVTLTTRRPISRKDEWADGGEIRVVCADAADEAAMRELFAEIEARSGPINGVLHAAGLTSDRSHSVIQDSTTEQSAAHFASKVHGTLVLERLLRERNVDFCLLFSSLSATLGGITLSAYAAANAFEESFAVKKSGEAGTRWIAVNWDTWKVGASGHEQKYKGLETTLAEFVMSPDEGTEALRRVLGSGRHHLINSTGDLGTRLDQWIYRKHLREKAAAKKSGVSTHYARPGLSTAYVPANNEAEERVARVFGDVLGIDKIGLHDNYFELGGNSLVALQVVAELQREFDVQLSPIAIFEYPTVSELARHLSPAGIAQQGPSFQQITDRRRSLRARGEQCDIAIIGMSGRFPGANNVTALWRNLVNGVESLTYFSDDELREAGVDPAAIRNPNYVKARAILEDIDQFDASFFGFSPREAELMDPQHRLLLETAVHTLEHAGYDSLRYGGSIGVFAGSNVSFYWLNMSADAELWAGLNRFDTGLGNDKDSLTTKISYKLNLKGPSFAIQTFCSTSGVAVHLACQSLRAGESDMALAGGVSIQAMPNRQGYLFEPNNQASPDGHTRTFDARAKGTVFADGTAMVLLKRLEDALADGDTIHAVIKGTAINNDGSLKAGYTAPSVERQAEVIALALADAGLTADDISHIEAHGTATELGDPIEVAALTKTFQSMTSARQFCVLGSLKTNIGHTDRAAGVIGLIKTVEMLKSGLIPPTLHFETPNPKIDLANSPFVVYNTLRQLPAERRPWRAGVNILGVGGTNAHIIVEQPPVIEPSEAGRPWHVLTLSAKTPTALEAVSADLATHLRERPDLNVADVAYTLQAGRREFNHRRVVVCRDGIEAATALEANDLKRVATSSREAKQRPLVFLFPGLGEQYGNMAAGLYASEPRFRSEVDRCCDLLKREIGIDLREVMFSEDDAASGRDFQKLFFRGNAANDAASTRLNQTWIAQPAMFVIEYALAQLLMSWGLVPQALIGYSVGEFTAATIAGSLSLEDGLRLVAARAKLIDALPGGAMAAVPVSEKDAAALLQEAGLTDALSIAACNGPKLTVLAGPAEAIVRLEAALQSRDLVSRRLPTTHAFHSRMLTPAYAEFVEILKTVTLRAPRIPYLSNLTGTWIRETEARDPEYWARHMCETVRFGDGVAEVLRGGDKVLVEVGPGQGLGSVVKQHPAFARQGESNVVSTMRTVYASDDDREVLLGALGRLWLAGTPIDWAGYYAGERRRRIPLPVYPFERQSYWLQPVKPVTSLASLEARAALEDWFYLPTWALADAADAANTEKCWLIFADAHGVGDGIAERAVKQGVDAIHVRPGAEYGTNPDGAFVIRIGERADYSRLLKELRKSGRIPSRIVHVWSAEHAPDDSIGDKLTRSFYSLFYLAQAIGDQLASDEIDLCVISSGMWDVTGDEDIDVETATVRGPVKVIRQEYAGVATRSIDLARTETLSEALLDQLTAEVASRSRDQFVALRGGQRWIQQFESVRMEVPAERSPRFRPSGVYLITGGLGGIGLAFAEYAFATVNAKLVLVGRSGLPPREQWAEVLAGSADALKEKIAKVQALEAAGAEVLVLAADVSSAEQMTDVVRQAVARFGTIHGVFHAAGVPGQGLTQLKSAETAAAVLAPKIQGTLALEAALKDIPLDFLLLVSSIASFTGGGPGQIDYCAGNAFLDAYARRNFRRHGITVAINFGEWRWDAWSAGLNGFAPEVREAFIANRRKFGIAFDEGMDAIHRVLATDVPQCVVVSQNFADMVAGSNECTAVRLTDEVNQTRKRQQKRYPRPPVATGFVAAGTELERKIAAIWQRVLGIDNIGVEDNFFELGGNSLVGLQVIADMNRELDVELTPVVLYELPTVSAFTRYLKPEQDLSESAREELVARRAQVRHTRTSREIAIVGMAGRFPGAANVHEFWRKISAGEEAIRFYSDAELIAAGVDPTELQNPNYVKAGGDLDGIDRFDATLFGYAPREAETIDPQHRFFLECAWEALEDAGYDPERYPGLIGVFGGSAPSRYYSNITSRPELLTSGTIAWQAGVGNSNDSLATRISYKLNLRGPSLAVQTFCSTSGVAVHMACQSLVTGECDMALAGGVNISVPNKTGYVYEEGGIISPDGHTRTFDAQAKGAVISDGVGIVVLKRLDEALADGDQIYAVIKGSAINNDGSVKVGYTAPSVEGQCAAILDALSIAGVDAETIGYVEAHGTATELGDPIEVTALSRAYGSDTQRKQFCAIGSVKTNVGHLDRAAGVTALIKTALSLRHEFLPPLLHFESPNPNIDFASSPFYVCAKPQAWKTNGAVRRAGVNVVGLGGTNVHLVLEEAPAIVSSDSRRDSSSTPQLLLLSAKTPAALEAATANLCAWLRDHPDADPDFNLADVAYTLQVGRRRLEHRRAVVCGSVEDALAALEANDEQRVLTSYQQPRKKSVVFMFADGGGRALSLARQLIGWGVVPAAAIGGVEEFADLNSHSIQDADRVLVDLGREEPLEALARLWLAGIDIDWRAYHRQERRRRVSLPTYPFDRQSFWIQSAKQLERLDRSQAEEPKAAVEDWFYLPAWKPGETLADGIASLSALAEKCWLIFADDGGAGVGIAKAIEQKGVAAIIVRPGAEYGAADDGSFVVRMRERADYSRLLKELRKSGRIPRRIVHLWTADRDRAGSSLDSLDDRLARSFYSLFYLAQAIGDQLTNDDIDLCVVSTGLWDVIGDEEISAEKAALRGPCKVIRQEYAQIASRGIDLSSAELETGDVARLAEQLTVEIASPVRDQFVAFRNGQRWTQTYEAMRMEAPTEESPRFRPSGVYLITGGMGGIGLAFAEYLYRLVGAKLVLVGRSGLPPKETWPEALASGDAALRDKIAKVRALEALGAEVLVVPADVSRVDHMEEVVRQAVARFGTIHGVFHAAGVPAQGLTQLKSAETAAAVMAPKIQGTLALEAALALNDIQLDFLLLASSTSAFLGGPGQIDYSAANAFLDAYARQNRRRNGITVAINFGDWQWQGEVWSAGLAGYPAEVREAFIAARQKYGMGLDEGMSAIHRVLCADMPQVIMLARSLFTQLEGADVCTAVRMTTEVSRTRRQQQRSYPRPALGTGFVAAGTELERKIAAIWQRVLGIDNIGVQDNFFELGGNSLVGLQVIADMKRELDVEITPVALYEAPTVSAFTRYLNPDQETDASAAGEELAARRAQARQTRTSREIAIIGMAGRFPGAKNVRELWENVRAGRESLRTYTHAEMIAAGVPREALRHPNYVKAGNNMDDIEYFDAMLFGYAPREAETIDPQHRFFLECAWEALEDAGYDSERYPGMIGVFGGAAPSGYYNNLMSRPDLTGNGLARLQAGVGNTTDALTTRVSYKLNLRGPSLTVQTFCSTSGVAAHMACQSLLAGECDMALAGGVNVIVAGKTGYLYEEGGIDSPDGHTRTFDAQAKGSVFGDAVGILVLKRLDEALADGDHVYAVIKGSAVNNDGSVKVGYTAPSVDGQCAAILDALAVAGVDAESVSYVEAHGTATELGDPIEVTALSRAYGQNTERQQFCALGSVKTNLGHLDRAAGVTALIKTAMSLRHEFLPPVLHFESPNPNIDFERSPFYVCAQPQVWRKNGVARRAGVNIVGLGGTNAHLILEEAPPAPASGPTRKKQLLLLSAKSESALDAAAANLGAWLRKSPDVNLGDVAYTLQVGRRRLEHRRAVVCGGVDDALTVLEGSDPQRVLSSYQQPRKKSVVFLFAGVGDQYANMAAELYAEEPEFKEQVDRCCDLLQPLLGLDLRTTLFTGGGTRENGGIDLRCMLKGTAPRASEADVVQPAVFVIEYSLAKLIMSWGIVPDAMIGYSLGEYVAATVAGVLSLQDALKLVTARAKLIASLPPGAMLAVALSEEEVAPLLGDQAWIAVSNSPKLTVVAGTEAAIGALEEVLARKEIVSRRVPALQALHTPMMSPASDALVRLVKNVELKEPKIAYISNVTGTWMRGEDACDVNYWARHMCERVRFSAGIQELLKDSDRVMVEIGAGQTLGALIKQQPGYGKEGGQVIVPTLPAVYQKQSDQELLLSSLGKLWLAGVQPDWTAFYARETRRRVALPAYPFERQRFWVEPGDGLVTKKAIPAMTGRNPDMAEWYYEPSWREAAIDSAGAAVTKPSRIWLLFADDSELSVGTAAGLERAGHRVVAVRAGSEFAKRDEASYEIQPGEAQDYEQLIQHLRDAGTLPNTIGHLWSAAADDDALTEADDFARWQNRGYYSLIFTVQALARQLVLDPLEVVMVSSNMQAVSGDERLCPAKATLLGPCKGIPQESPHIICRSVDLQGEAASVEQLVAELLSESAEPAVAYRNGKRLVQDFVPVRVEALGEDETRLRPHGVYLITGGLGGVGLILARHLAAKVRARLVLIGRSGLPPREKWNEWVEQHGEEDATSQRIAKVRAIEELGAEVLVVAADVANEQQMAAAVDQAYQRFGALHGVVHAAGNSDGRAFRAVQEIGRADSESHFQPKVYGMLALEKALDGKDLDFCLLTSSLSSVLAGITFVAYSSGNIYMDAFTHRHNRRAGATPWLTVNWDTWRVKVDQYGSLGKTIAEFEKSPEEGCEVFDRLIFRHRAGQIVECTGDLETRLDQWIRRKSLQGASDPSSAQKATLYARPNLQNAYIPTSNDVEEKIAGIWQQVLGIENVGIHDNYFDLGGTSLSAIQVISQLQRTFSVPVSPIVLFEAPTVSELAKRLGPATSRNGGAGDTALTKVVARRKAVQKKREGTDIAIVGMAGRFPKANNVDELWRNLLEGVESLTTFTEEELLEAGADPEEVSNPNYIPARPIIENADHFDANFFGYSPRDAELMDPQHRLMLEVAWEALESAGYDSLRYDGSIGVFAGTNISFYLLNLYADRQLNMFEANMGNDKDSLTTKISYKLNLKGPSLAVQTFCSTSLVSVHLACQSLRNGESDIALAGGVSLKIPTTQGYLYKIGDQDSPDGHTRTFDAQAKGTNFGDGAAMVVLKRLDDAVADGDTIHAIVKGSAINNDGSLKVSYTAPSVERQAEVVVLALADAGLTASDLSYIEAHGTATELGDPIEVAALTRAFRASTQAKQFCAIGSVKTHIGHVDRASGVTGLIKTVESLKAGLLPGVLHFQAPNPKIDFENSPFFVNDKTRRWERNGKPRRAGITSLGVGGTNAHVIVEEAPIQPATGASRPWQLLLVSARTSSALDKACDGLAGYLDRQPDANLADVAYTLQVGRRRFAHRRAMLCQTRQEAEAALLGRESKHVLTYYEEPRTRSIAFMFPGVGDHYEQMAAGLYQSEPEFRQAVDQCCDLLKPILGIDLRRVMFPEGAAQSGGGIDLRKMIGGNGGNGAPSAKTSELQRTYLAQPAVFVIGYSLAQLLISWGIVPQALIGYSVGEFVAATIAGALSLEDALRLVATRAKLIDKLPGGSMLAVPLGESEVKDRLGPELSIAVANGPKLTIVAGPAEALEEFNKTLDKQGIVTRMLTTTHAFHSRMMEPAFDEFIKLLKTVNLQTPRIPYLSNLTGDWIKPEEATDPRYWAKHMCQTVRFADGVEQLLRMKEAILLEVGPGQSLSSLVKLHPGCDSSRGQFVMPTMRSQYDRQPDEVFLLTTVARLWLSGIEIDWNGFYAREQRRRIPLPTYPFERQRFWIETNPKSKAEREQAQASASGPVRREPDIADWFYVPVWKQAKPVLPSKACALEQPARRWLVFADDSRLCEKVTDALMARGESVTLVGKGTGFARTGHRAYSVDPSNRNDFDQLLDELSLDEALPNRVVHLWNLVPPAEEMSRAARAEMLLERGFRPLLSLTQALGERDVENIRMLVVASGMLKVTGDEALVPENATLTGPCRIIEQEYAGIGCRGIDVVLPPAGSAREDELAAKIVLELTQDSADSLVAYRGGQRWTQNFEPLRFEPVGEPPTKLRQSGVYLITGGLGGIGLAIAEHLARMVEARLVLVGRSGLPPREQWDQWLEVPEDELVKTNRKETADKIWQVLAIEAMGSEVLVLSADVADAAQMRSVIHQTIERFGQLNGVFHAAGVLGQGLMQLRTREASRDMLAPKVAGLISLDDALADVPVDFLVLISSMAAITGGGPGQLEYCAGNAYLDAYAQAVNSIKRPVISIDWGEWRWNGWEIGLEGFDPEVREMLRENRRKNGIAFEEGMDALNRVLEYGLPQVVVSTQNFQMHIDGSKNHTVANILQEAKKLRGTATRYPRPALGSPYVAPANECERKLADIWQELLGIDRVGSADSFFELGGHSLLATQLFSWIRKEFKVSLSLRSIFDMPTIAGQAEMIAAVNWTASGADVLASDALDGEVIVEGEL